MSSNVLITGGSGFLGRAIARHLLAHSDAERICIYSRGEYAQASMRMGILDPDERLRWFIGDVRDHRRLRWAMSGIDLVIHAAALKRVEVGEYNPAEMVRTNVDGALNVVEAALEAHVAKVVAISSDKACEPLNCYGATKLVAEKLFLAANATAGAEGTRFAVCRYGNVSGSTGSVIPTWRAILDHSAAAIPCVPVTDPGCTRFWMTLAEAVRLVLWTADNMLGGEIVVPFLPTYRLGDIARAMGATMRVTGIGPGEKLDETLIAPFESARFRYVEAGPYLIAGGLAEHLPRTIEWIAPRMLTVEELRERLKEIQ